MTAKIFTTVFHSIPHLSLSFKRVEPSFLLDYHSDYVQSLIVFLILALFIGGVLLLTIIITWICQCCARQDPTVKSRRRMQQISTVLFVISILCFFALGISLFANEHINRGVSSSVSGLDYVTNNFRLAFEQCVSLNKTFNNATRHVDELSGEVEIAASQTPEVDKKALSDVQKAINGLSKNVGDVSSKLLAVEAILKDVSFLEKARRLGGTAEFERWVLLVTLLSIMLVVLFIGVIAFCRQSKKGTIMFSGLGFAIFIVGWLLLAAVFPLTISWADFCSQSGTFMKMQLSQDMIEALNFYETCEALQPHDNTPPVMHLRDISGELSDLQKAATDLEISLRKLFNDTDQFKTNFRLILDDVTRSLKNVGALDNQIACYGFHDDVNRMQQGFCETGMFGSALLVISLLSLSFFMFILLLIVSKSWYLFKKLPTDYVEVDDEDPFFPRGNESTIPVDIYGTHVYNPRTRYANSLDRTEPSTGTTIAAGIANGSTSTQPSASTALLAGETEWQRATAPPSNPAVFSSPPAYGEVSLYRPER